MLAGVPPASARATSSALAARISARRGEQRVGHRPQRGVLGGPGRRGQLVAGRPGPTGDLAHCLLAAHAVQRRAGEPRVIVMSRITGVIVALATAAAVLTGSTVGAAPPPAPVRGDAPASRTLPREIERGVELTLADGDLLRLWAAANYRTVWSRRRDAATGAWGPRLEVLHRKNLFCGDVDARTAERRRRRDRAVRPLRLRRGPGADRVRRRSGRPTRSPGRRTRWRARRTRSPASPPTAPTPCGRSPAATSPAPRPGSRGTTWTRAARSTPPPPRSPTPRRSPTSTAPRPAGGAGWSS